MSQQLIGHSPDLKQLRDEGYEIEIYGGHLLVHHIPYVNNQKEIKYGSMVCELTMINEHTLGQPSTHVMHFSGEHPCHKDGSIITQIQNSAQNQLIRDGLTINYSFSNKPSNGYIDYYQKVKRYADIISDPAKSLDKTVTEKTFRLIPEDDSASVFNYMDTNSSRANIGGLNNKFIGQKIAIVGLGGTGAYILDMVAKTPVQEIHLYDGDDFFQHNAFRSPGAASGETLAKRMKKVQYYEEMYSKIHRHIIPHISYISEGNIHELNSMSYVFICVDKNSVRKDIMHHLLQVNVPFIDVGMGINIIDDKLIGIVRVTMGTLEKYDHLEKRIPVDDTDNDEYKSNIQIADLNALNAMMAIIKWKKKVGFYQDLENEHHCTYSINMGQLLNEDITS